MEPDKEKIPKGYKLTEVGVIPEDWMIKNLEEFGILTMGQSPPGNSYSSNYRDMPLLNGAKDLTESGIMITQYTNKPIRVSKRGDLLFCIRATIGNLQISDRTYCLGRGIAALTVNKSFSKIFVAYVLRGLFEFMRNQSQGGVIKGLKKDELAEIKVFLPALKQEQTAIAEVLSDVDSLIDNLDKLIVKKKAIKQGVMQELLTGKRRLSGFSGRWEMKQLGEIAEIFKGQGLSKEKLSLSGEYPCILYGELFTTYSEKIDEAYSRTNFKEGRLSERGDVLMPGSTTTVGIDLAKASAILIDNVQLGGDINIIRQLGNSSYNSIFLAYCITHIYKNRIAQRTKGITIYHLYGNDLVDLEILMPEMLEQTAIATILSDMDAEIEALEEKLSKYKMLKQGMMQVLLTGKVRLI
ncbi:restriction endonuclease subunit S [bacterium]|nr:restriction endonuclease subunit S [bacterium]